MNRATDRARLVAYYRYHVMAQMRRAGMSFAAIAEYFLLSRQRVAQILKRGILPAQLSMPDARPSD